MPEQPINVNFGDAKMPLTVEKCDEIIANCQRLIALRHQQNHLMAEMIHAFEIRRAEIEMGVKIKGVARDDRGSIMHPCEDMVFAIVGDDNEWRKLPRPIARVHRKLKDLKGFLRSPFGYLLVHGVRYPNGTLIVNGKLQVPRDTFALSEQLDVTNPAHMRDLEFDHVIPPEWVVEQKPSEMFRQRQRIIYPLPR